MSRNAFLSSIYPFILYRCSRKKILLNSHLFSPFSMCVCIYFFLENSKKGRLDYSSLHIFFWVVGLHEKWGGILLPPSSSCIPISPCESVCRRVPCAFSYSSWKSTAPQLYTHTQLN